MNAAVRPIHLPGAAALESLRLRALAALDAWAHEWAPSLAECTQLPADLTAGSADSAGRSFEYDAVAGESGCMWFRRLTVDRLKFGRGVVGAEWMLADVGVDPWITAAVDRAWAARNRALCDALLGAPAAEPLSVMTEPPAASFAFGSGAVQFEYESCGLYAIADDSIWHSVPPSQRGAGRLSKLTPLDRAAQRSNVHVDALLGRVEVPLPQLLDLRCGDVLRLPDRIDRGITLLCEGKPFARAALGVSNGHKCVQLTGHYT